MGVCSKRIIGFSTGLSGKPSPSLEYILYQLSTFFVGTWGGVFRRVEDKCEAKGLHLEAFTLRTENPPSAKKKPLVYPGWLIMDNAGKDVNAWAPCLLAQDRQGSLQFEKIEIVETPVVMPMSRLHAQQVCS